MNMNMILVNYRYYMVDRVFLFRYEQNNGQSHRVVDLLPGIRELGRVRQIKLNSILPSLAPKSYAPFHINNARVIIYYIYQLGC